MNPEAKEDLEPPGKMPTPPLHGRGDTPGERRRFLTWVAALFGGATAAIVGLPVLGLLLAPVTRRRNERWFGVGEVERFPIGETLRVTYSDPDVPWAGSTANRAAYVRRTGASSFEAFSIFCTHTGCPVNWVPGAKLFLCPCHGGAFDREGAVVSGPPPRPLERVEVRIRGERVEIFSVAVPLEASLPAAGCCADAGECRKA